jgi:hypothetical protein
MLYTKDLVLYEAAKHAPNDKLKICACGMPYGNHAAHMVVMLTIYFEMIVEMLVAENDVARLEIEKLRAV